MDPGGGVRADTFLIANKADEHLRLMITSVAVSLDILGAGLAEQANAAFPDEG